MGHSKHRCHVGVSKTSDSKQRLEQALLPAPEAPQAPQGDSKVAQEPDVGEGAGWVSTSSGYDPGPKTSSHKDDKDGDASFDTIGTLHPKGPHGPAERAGTGLELSSCVQARAQVRRTSGRGLGGLMWGLQHLHKEGVNGCVPDELEKEQVLQALEPDGAQCGQAKQQLGEPAG